MTPYSVLKTFEGKQVLVTGGTGMIGRQVVSILHQAGARVTTVSLDPQPEGWLVGHVRQNLSGLEETCWLIKQYGRDYMFHLAGKKGSLKVTRERPADYFIPILLANTVVLEAARLVGVGKLVYTSSIGAYTEPEDDDPFREDLDWWDVEGGAPMDLFPGWAKRMGELQIRAYALQYGMSNFVPVRLAACYGPGDNFGQPEDAMVVTALLGKLRRGERRLELWGDGSAVRDWCYSRDAAEGIVLAAAHGVGPQFYNIGSGVGHSVHELAETLQKVVDFSYGFNSQKPGGFDRRVLDITRARTELGFNPSTSLEQGLRETWGALQ